MHIDDELIKDLRKTLAEYDDGVAGISRVIVCAREILAEADRGPQKIVDRDGDVWIEQPDGAWQMDGLLHDGRRVTRDYIEEHYGPTRLAN